MKTQTLICKRVEGEVQYNNGEFAEVLTFGIDGFEKDLALETIQIHCEEQMIHLSSFSNGSPLARH